MYFAGEGIASLTLEDRMTLTNMAIEAGGKNGICDVDEKTLAYVRARSNRPEWEVVKDDADAKYDYVHEWDLSKLEPLVAKALVKSDAQSWMSETLGRGEEAFMEALGTLLGQSGKGWILHPAEALDETSLRVLKGSLERGASTVVLLRQGAAGCPAAGHARRIRLLWLPPAAEAWYLEHARALLGSDTAAWLLALERCPDDQPRCSAPLLPPLPQGFSGTARPCFGGRKGTAFENEAPEAAARMGHLGTLYAASHRLRAEGAGAEGRFWEGVVFFLMGQPALALAAW